MLTLALSGAVASTGIQAQPGVAQGPYVVNFLNLASQPAALERRSSPAVIHRHNVPAEEQGGIASQPAREGSAFTLEQVLLQTSPLPATDFEGQDQTEWIPPDTNGAVSSQWVLTTVNNDVNIRDRSGNFIAGMDLSAFWAATNTTGSSFDTRSRFDAYGQRFIIISAGSLGDHENSSVLLAVSQTSDPRGNWILYRAPIDTPHWVDYPTIGFNSKWIVVHGNMFPIDGSGAGFITTMWVFDKANLYAGAAGNYNLMPGRGVTTQPAETYDATTADLYLLQQDSDCSVALHRLSGSIGAEVATFIASVPAPQCWTGGIPGAPQAGSDGVIFPGIDWMMDAVFRNGAVWGTQVVQPTTGPIRTVAQWWRIGTGGNLIDFGRVDDTSGVAYYGFPSIAVNVNNDALIGFTRFSEDTFPSAAYAVRAASDPAGTFQQPVVYKSGLTPYGASRWGDFSHTQVDPANDRDFWTVQEITGQNGWATWWGKVNAPDQAQTNINVQLRSGNTGLTNSPHPQLRVVNQGTGPLSLDSLILRYWFNCDCNPANTTMNGAVDWAGILPMGLVISPQTQLSFEQTSSGGQTHAMVIRFTGNLQLQPGQTVEVHTRFNKPDWSNMPQDNDYSFAAFTGYTSWNRVTANVNGTLVWGVQP